MQIENKWVYVDEFHATAARLNREDLQQRLATQLFGRGDRLRYLPVVDSTNTVALHLAYDVPEEGVVVLTESQTAGKGRLGRRWMDVSGCNVLASTVLCPLFPPHLLVMLASLAVVDAITDMCALTPTLKWPNDVLIEGRKVAGILIETSHSRSGQFLAILGIGVNVNGRSEDLALESVPKTASLRSVSQMIQPTPTTLAATTLEAETGFTLSRESFIAHLLQHLEDAYFALQQEAANEPSASSTLYGPVSRLIRERWRNLLTTLGQTIEVRQGDTVLYGMAEDVDDSGELLLRLHSGELKRITWGDVGYPAR